MTASPSRFHRLFRRGAKVALALAALLAVSACSSAIMPSAGTAPTSPPLSASPAGEDWFERAGDDGTPLEKLADSELESRRGGMKVGSLDLSIGVEVVTTASDGVELVSQLVVNDAGKLQAANGASSASFAAGDSAATRVIHALMNNNISTVITNRANNTTINQRTILDITVNNFATQQAMAAQMRNSVHFNAIAGDIARFH